MARVRAKVTRRNRQPYLIRSSCLDKQNALGWGSKSTQFHGSLGKAAAAAAPPSANPKGSGLSPDDDLLPRISWRGDAGYFSVSSVESTSDTVQRHRIIRVYSLTPSLVLNSTVELTPGLEHSLSWNPSGSLIASTQRYGSRVPGLGAGREGRHDVVFFERNGLRRSSFEIVKGGEKSENALKDGWGYRVRDIAWSSDSSALAVWIHTEDDGDVGEFSVLLLNITLAYSEFSSPNMDDW